MVWVSGGLFIPLIVVGSIGAAIGQLPSAAIANKYGWEAFFYFLMVCMFRFCLIQ
jgi:sugar phosphate permease